ncbi:uncharacterized protein LOC124162681 [Ischnura elegans]|uniref:uncharacterized protein LOC124162681 n=1 Tax=Ischnura elegans TaxID=197161 RepID=UPI001ED8BA47|nr:uncharacterized protein LOC124162681 [Ischnura elegans]
MRRFALVIILQKEEDIMHPKFPLLLVTAAAVAYLVQTAPLQTIRDHPRVANVNRNEEISDPAHSKQVPVDYIINQSLSIPIAILQSLQIYLTNITKTMPPYTANGPPPSY